MVIKHDTLVGLAGNANQTWLGHPRKHVQLTIIELNRLSDGFSSNSCLIATQHKWSKLDSPKIGWSIRVECT